MGELSVKPELTLDFDALHEALLGAVSQGKLSAVERASLSALLESDPDEERRRVHEELLEQFRHLNQLDQIEEALAFGLQSLAKHQAAIELRLELAWLLIERGELDAAEALSRPLRAGQPRAIEDRERAKLLSLRAELQLLRHDYQGAARSAHLAHELDASCPWGLLALSQVHHWRGEHRSQRHLLQRALVLCPEHPLALSRWLLRPDSTYHPRDRLRDAERAFERSPGHRGLQQGYSYALSLMGRLEEAEREAAALVKRNLSSPSARLIHAFTLCRLRRSAEALSEVERALKRSPQCPAGLLVSVCILASLGRREALRAPLSRLEQLASGSPRIELWYAEALNSAREPERAQQQLARLVERWPQRGEFIYALAAQLARGGEPESALLHCEALLRKHPEHLPGKLLSLDLHLTLGDEELAAQRLAELEDHPDAVEGMLRLFCRQGRFSEVLALARQQRRLQPMRAEWPEYEIIALWQSEEEILPALQELDRSLRIEQRSAALDLLLSYLFVYLEQLPRARELLYAGLENLEQERPKLRKRRLIFACEAAEQLEEGGPLELLAAALEARAPEHPMTHYYRALVEWDKGAREEALRRVLRALESAPEERRLLLLLGHWCCERGEHQQASDAYARALSLEEDEGQRLEVHGWLGYAQLRAGLFEAASESFTPLQRDFQSACEALRWHLQACQEEQNSLLELGLEPLSGDRARQCLELADEWLQALREASERGGVSDEERALLTQLQSDWYFLQGQELAGLSLLEEASRAVAQPEWIWNLALRQEQRGERAAARRNFERASQLRPGLNQISLDRCLFLLRSGELEEAFLFIQELFTKEEEKVGGRLELLRECFEELLEQSEGELLLDWVDYFEEHDQLSERAFFSGYRGAAYLWRGEPQRALPYLLRAWKSEPQFLIPAAQCLWDLQERDAAVSLLSEGLKENPTEAELHRLLAEYLHELGAGEDAWAHFEQLHTLEPQAEGLHELRETLISARTLH